MLVPYVFPVKMYQKLAKLYPEEKLLAHPLEKRQQQMTYSEECEQKMKYFVSQHLRRYVPQALIFECQS